MSNYRSFSTIAGAFILALTALLPISSVSAIETGHFAPDFSLTTYDGKPFKLSEQQGKIVVLEWFNPGCPFVKHQYTTGNMPTLQVSLAKRGVVWVTINSTNPGHGDFLTPEKAQQISKDFGLKGSYLLRDELGTVGKLYGAKTTPHMFVIDTAGKLTYQGAIDDDSDIDSDPKQAKNFVSAAVAELLSGKSVGVASTNSYGCSIKYSS
jgi:peroxiredoxin